MDDQTVVAAPSAAQESTAPSLEIPRSGSADYTEWRISGKLPESKPKTEEAATSSEADRAETRTASEAGKTSQEKSGAKAEQPKPKTAEERIAQLESTIEKIRKGAGLDKTQKAESSPARVEPQPKPQVQHTRPKPTAEDKNQDGSAKYGTYEDFIEELADWKAEQRWAGAQREAAEKAQAQEFAAKIEAARSRYENFDEVINPFVGEFVADPTVSSVVKQMVNDSDVFADLVFTLAGDAKFMAVAQREPGKAIRYIAKVESLIQDELAKGSATSRNEQGQFASASKPDKPEPPAKRGPESAPEPPLEIGSRGTGPMDESARALSAIERGDPNAVRAWMRAENARELRQRKGL